MLGEGNRFTLGSQGNVDDEAVGAVVCELLRQTMWFVDVAHYTFLKLGMRPEPHHAKRALAYRDEVQAVAKRLPKLFSDRPKGAKPSGSA